MVCTSRFSPSLIQGLCALFASNSRFMRLFQAALDTPLDSPFSASLSLSSRFTRPRIFRIFRSFGVLGFLGSVLAGSQDRKLVAPSQVPASTYIRLYCNLVNNRLQDATTMSPWLVGAILRSSAACMHDERPLLTAAQDIKFIFPENAIRGSQRPSPGKCRKILGNSGLPMKEAEVSKRGWRTEGVGARKSLP